MSIDIERTVAEILMEQIGVKAVLEVPNDRPDEFLSVELTSTGGTRFAKTCFLAVQSWAKTRKEASELASLVEEITHELEVHPNIFSPQATNTYRFPDPDSGQERYQTTIELLLCE